MDKFTRTAHILEMFETILVAGQKAADPPLLAPKGSKVAEKQRAAALLGKYCIVEDK